MTSRNIIIWILSGVLACLAFPLRCEAAEETITLAGTQEGKNTADGRWAVLIYTEAFHRLGYRLEIQSYPVARASMLSDNGDVDGEISRAYDYGKSHPNLIRVEEPHFSIVFAAFAARPGIRVEGWESLRNTAYKIEYRLGIRKTKTALQQVVTASNLSGIATVELGLRKLIMNRTDIYIDSESTILETLRELNRSGVNTAEIYEAGVMETTPAHLFLHKRHTDLAPKIAAVLKEMKQEGVVEQYRRRIEQEP